MRELDSFCLKNGSDSAAERSKKKANTRPLKLGQCRLFPADAQQMSDGVLRSLGESMKSPTSESGKASTLPAGYVFLSQFIEHDVTTPAESGDLEGVQCRTLNLDSVYGAGETRHLLRDSINPDKLTVGTTLGSGEFGISHSLANDLPRFISGVEQGRVFIGDNRNDLNLGVAQTHLQFLKLHNRFVDLGMNYHQARLSTIQHYQSMVINDYLKRILNPNIFSQVFNRPSYVPFAPVSTCLSLEFSFSAFRFIYSMFSAKYEWNRIYQSAGQAGPISIRQLFCYFDPATHSIVKFRLPTHWIIDWSRFYEFRNENQELVRNMARQIGAGHCSELNNLVDRPEYPGNRLSNLATRILLCGKRLLLASGETAVDILNERGLTLQKLDNEQLGIDGFAENQNTPLWYYLMRESQIQQNGNTLGELGSWIVADGFKRLILDSPNSVLSDTNFSAQPGVLHGSNSTSMRGIIRFNNDINPLHDV